MQGNRAGNVDRPTRLLVVGDTPYAVVDGRLHTFAALSKQLDLWFSEFDEVQIAAHQIAAPEPGFRALARDDLELVPLPVGGGIGLKAKLGVAARMFVWAWMLIPLLRRATAIHVRTPCNVAMAALPLAWVLNRRRYAIFAGNWEPTDRDAYSYSLQRWLLSRWGGVVHAYAPPSDDLPAHVRPNVSPSFSLAELDALAPAVADRLERIRTDPVTGRELRVCSVGTISRAKNQIGLVRAVKVLSDRGIDVELRIAGTGRLQREVRALVEELGLGDRVRLLGQVDHPDLQELYRWADINALVARGEGFGKIFPEGMAVGCPAVCGRGRMQLGMIGGGTRGRQAESTDPMSIATAFDELRSLSAADQEAMVAACTEYARSCTIDAFGVEVRHIVHGIWELPPRSTAPVADA